MLRTVLIAGDDGLTEAELADRCESLDPATIEDAVESLLASGLLELREARLHPSGPASRFNRFNPL